MLRNLNTPLPRLLKTLRQPRQTQLHGPCLLARRGYDSVRGVCEMVAVLVLLIVAALAVWATGLVATSMFNQALQRHGLPVPEPEDWSWMRASYPPDVHRVVEHHAKFAPARSLSS
jgi:hypothetical protein